jgi:hypothetical protein
MTDRSPEIRALFHRQAEDCRSLGSPFTARLMDVLARTLDRTTTIGRRILDWPPNVEDNLPLRLAGGLHALARSGDAGLAAIYPPAEASDALFAEILARALQDHGTRLMPWLDNPPQTNEVARSAVLIAAAHWLTARFALPLHLSELGASAGLNLMWDHYGLDLPGLRLGPADPVLVLRPDWTGPPPPSAAPQVLSRAGADLAPIDPVAGRDRLLAYVWADQKARLDRATAALDLAARLRPQITRADAADWAGMRLAQTFPGALHLVFHTIAATYFPPETTARLQAALTAAGARATAQSPLAHLAMERDARSPGAGITLTLWPGGTVIELGRTDFHGRWVSWQAPAP